MNKALLVVGLFLAGCSSLKKPIDAITPYKLDIPQGNVVTQAMLDQLKPGMTRAQVRFVLGTPLVVDPFRTNRWDYVYRLEKSGRLAQQRHITVVFEKDVLKGIEGNVVPAAVKDKSKSKSKGGTP